MRFALKLRKAFKFSKGGNKIRHKIRLIAGTKAIGKARQQRQRQRQKAAIYNKGRTKAIGNKKGPQKCSPLFAGTKAIGKIRHKKRDYKIVPFVCCRPCLLVVGRLCNAFIKIAGLAVVAFDALNYKTLVFCKAAWQLDIDC